MEYCMYCGTVLEENAIFCHVCGNIIGDTSVPDSNSVSKANGVAVLQSNSVKQVKNVYIYDFLGEKIIIDLCELHYFRLKNIFSSYHGAALSEFQRQYLDSVRGWDSLTGKGLEIYEIFITKSFDFGSAILKKFGLVQYRSRDIQIQSDPQFYNSVIEYYDSRENSLERLARQLGYELASRKARRGYWVGGGFGVKGAIKGAMTAGAMNAASGLVHGIGDSIAEGRSRRKIEKAKAACYSEQNHLSFISVALSKQIEDVFQIVTAVLIEKDIITIPSNTADSRECLRELEEIKETLKNCGADCTDVKTKALHILSRNPIACGSEVCAILYQIPGTSKQQLLEYAEFCEFLGDYTANRDKIIREMIQDVDLMPSGSVPEIEIKIGAYQNLISWDDIIDVHDKIESLKTLQKTIIDSERRFEIIRSLPEKTLEDLRKKTEELKSLYQTETIQRENRRVQVLLDEAEEKHAEQSGIQLAKKCAMSLIRTEIFQELGACLTDNLLEVLRLIANEYAAQTGPNLLFACDIKGNNHPNEYKIVQGFKKKGEPIFFLRMGTSGMILTNYYLFFGIEKGRGKEYTISEIHDGMLKSDWDAMGNRWLYCDDYSAQVSNLDNIDLIRELVYFFRDFCCLISNQYISLTGNLLNDCARLTGLRKDQILRSYVGEADAVRRQAHKFCFECGEQNDATAKFCFNCGAVFE